MSFEKEKNSRWQLSDFVHHLESKVDVRPLMPSEFPKPMVRMVNKNAVYAVKNKRLQLTAEELYFAYYELEMTEKSRSYLSQTEKENFESFYAVFEERTGYIWSNCDKLFLELIIEEGVTEEDVKDQEMDYLLSYRFYLESYIKKYGKKALGQWVGVSIKGGQQIKIQPE